MTFMQIHAIVLLLLLAVFCAAAYRIGRRRILIKRERFAQRPSIPVGDIYRSFYADSGLNRQEVTRLWNLVASAMKLDPEKLRPGDRFKEDMGPIKGHLVPDELEDLEALYERRCGELGIKPKHGMVITLDDFIRFHITGKSAR